MRSTATTRPRRLQVRTLFLSDIHLGYRHARVTELAQFLGRVEAQSIVLVGDIVDALSLARRAFWSPGHTEIVRILLARQRAGTRLIYIPGNHDASLAVLAQMLQGQFEVHREWVHRTARGERLLVMHGDQFDHLVDCPRWLALLGDALYYGTVAVSHRLNDLRRLLGKPYWPLVERVKVGLATSLRYIERFEHAAARHARDSGYDGVVCGHIHRANLRHIEGTLYCNTGDWVESCSALAESADGSLRLLRWPQVEITPARSGRRLLADAA